MKDDDVTVHIKAPAGGATSNVNGDFYKGGRFMPVNGLSCGALRKVKKVADTETRNWAAIKVEMVSSGAVYVRFMYAGDNTFTRLDNKFRFGTYDEAVQFAEALLDARSKKYIDEGLLPHPTEIIKHSEQAK